MNITPQQARETLSHYQKSHDLQDISRAAGLMLHCLKDADSRINNPANLAFNYLEDGGDRLLPPEAVRTIERYIGDEISAERTRKEIKSVYDAYQRAFKEIGIDVTDDWNRRIGKLIGELINDR